MEFNELKQKVLDVLERNGYFVNNEMEEEELYFDSLQFMTTLIDLEQEFNIVIPDEYIYDNRLNNLQAYYELIIKLQKGIN